MFRRLVLAAALILSIGLSGCACCDQLSGAGDEQKDNMARADYFESAALTYYDGARYDMSALQWRKVLAIKPEAKKAKRGLAKALYMQAAGPTGGTRNERAHLLRESQAIFEEIVKLPWTRQNMQGGTVDRKFEVQTDLALVYAELGDLYDRDIRDLNAAIKTDPNADEVALQSAVARETGKRDDLLNKSIPVFHRVLQASAKNPYAMAGLAKVNMQLGNDEEGIRWAKAYLAQSQESQINWKAEMEAYETAAKGQMQDEQRRIFVQKIVGAREKEKKTWLMLASVYMRRMEFGQAVNAYTRVIKLDAAVPAAYVERAQAYGALNEYKLAISDLEEYLKITDPMLHRTQRMNAVEMLDRYQAARARQGVLDAKGAGYGGRPSNRVR